MLSKGHRVCVQSNNVYVKVKWCASVAIYRTAAVLLCPTISQQKRYFSTQFFWLLSLRQLPPPQIVLPSAIKRSAVIVKKKKKSINPPRELATTSSGRLILYRDQFNGYSFLGRKPSGVLLCITHKQLSAAVWTWILDAFWKLFRSYFFCLFFFILFLSVSFWCVAHFSVTETQTHPRRCCSKCSVCRVYRRWRQKKKNLSSREIKTNAAGRFDDEE